MHLLADRLIFAATDLTNFLACRHRVGLDMAAAHALLARPYRTDRFLEALRQKGSAHERRFVDWLRAQGLHVVDLTGEEDPHAKTRTALEAGVDVVVQAALGGDGWTGFADVLRRVERPSRLGVWSYEAYDTKLARETRGGTILQLALYSDLLATVQGCWPERFHVVSPSHGPPHHVVHSYRLAEYAAYYRLTRSRFVELAGGDAATVQQAFYPEPVEHCDVCHWWARCNARRRADDHLSFIAGIGRDHRAELAAQGVPTLAVAAAMPVPVTFKPSRGSAETYGRLGHQARVQHAQRTTGTPVVELLPVQTDEEATREGPAGLRRLPPPSPDDLFLDLEGARFARDGGREYLFGVWSAEGYRAWWAFNDREEKAAFEAVVDFIGEVVARHPGAHIYHFNHYEPTAFKRLAGRHVTRAEALDSLLRAERFVDLLPIVRQSVRAGVESYSIKQLEQYYAFARDIDLRAANAHLQAMELALENGGNARDLAPELCGAIEGYNRDDCRSAGELRSWLESRRAELEAQGMAVPRPAPKTGEAPPNVTELEREAETLRTRLLDGLAPEAADPAHVDHPRWLLAFLVDWHRRESRAQWWEYYRLLDLAEGELYDEARALAGLTFVERRGFKTGKTGKATKTVYDRYRYPAQDVEIRKGAELWAADGSKFGTVAAVDREARTIDIEKGPSRVDLHPATLFEHSSYSSDALQRAVLQMAHRALAGDTRGCGFDLLYRRTPRLVVGSFAPQPAEDPVDFAVRIVTDLDHTTLAIQGPPGAGKTYAGARMIRTLVSAGKRIGVTAVSHKVIANLLEEVARQAAEAGEQVRLAHRRSEGDDGHPDVLPIGDNDRARAAIGAGEIDVLGGTVYLWARPEMADAVDVLFVDEAGQMSLANVLACARAAGSLVLLGDPQQLEQPQKAAHPDGVDVSALQHVIGAAKTMPAARGIFMDRTWRLAPAVCAFTSELFYDGQLHATDGLERQRLLGAGPFDGAGLWWVPLEHEGNRSASNEEVERVAAIVDLLLQPGAQWIDATGRQQPLTAGDLRVVAPFNAQVNRLHERLAARGVPVGTVDRFQGQTAAVVIYSMASSRAEDAPRGMEFLYDLNRLNVATSRARCAAIVVSSPRLAEPDCRTPRQMQLANALCRFTELATVWRPAGVRATRAPADADRLATPPRPHQPS